MKQFVLLVILFMLSSLTYEAPTLAECRSRTGINYRPCDSGLSRKCDDDCNCPCPAAFPPIYISPEQNCPERFRKICPSSLNCLCFYMH